MRPHPRSSCSRSQGPGIAARIACPRILASARKAGRGLSAGVIKCDCPAWRGLTAAPSIRINDGAQHDAMLFGAIIAGAPVHGGPLVPHQHIADPPAVVI